MTEAAPAEAGAVAEKKRPLLRRVPTSLIVTLVGIALTAWLLPAFTRQWDDRQKARDLKAAFVGEIASATSQALVQSRQVKQHDFTHVVGDAVGWNNYARLSDTWLRSSTGIEAKLQAYFPQATVQHWRSFQQSMYAVFSLASSPGGDPGLAWLASQIGVPAARFKHDLRLLRQPRVAASYVLSEKLTAFTDVETAVLAHEESLIDEILAAPVTGYSTSTHDLLRDLVP